MSKKIEESPITNEAELSAALKIMKKLEGLLLRQSLNFLVLGLLELTFLFSFFFDYMEYYVFDNGFLGVLGGIAFFSISATPFILYVRFLINKHRPFEEEIERYVNENPAILDNSSGTLSEQELSYLLSLKREDGANLQKNGEKD